MKFKEHSSSAVKVGDIKSNAVSIDAVNLGFITTILSSGLYSKPIPSFIREIVSNAWDSHVESNNTTQPVVLELGQTSEGQHFCKIQDFGVGLSPERFDKVYRKIGSSTKRGTNDQIGGFGIGRFSALSYSNVVKITSYHDNTEYSYLMCKENNHLSIDLLYSKSTTEPNGVSVEIDIKSNDVQKFVDAIEDQLAYFNNLIVIESISGRPYGLEKRFNNFKIKNYKNFSVNTLNSVCPTILLGKVSYPIRFSDLKKRYSYAVTHGYPIALKFGIGDIGVTPNREELLYTTEAIKAIEDALDASIKEIDTLFKEQNSKNYQDYDEFFACLEKTNALVLVEDDNNTVSVKKTDSLLKKTFRGKEYLLKNVNANLVRIKSYNVKESIYTLSAKNTLNSSKGHYTYLGNTVDTEHVYISDMSELKTHTKAYIRETFPEGSVFIKDVNKKKLAKGLIKWVKLRTFDYDSDALKLVIRYVEHKYDSFSKFTNADVPKKFIDDRKALAKANRSSVKREENYWKQNVNLLEERSFEANKSNNYELNDLNTKFKSLVVYSFKGDPRLESLHSSFVKVKFVSVAPTKMKLLKDLSNFVNIEDFMDKKYKAIRNLATAMHLEKKIPELQQLSRNTLLSSVSVRLYTELNTLALFCRDNVKTHSSPGLNEEIYQYCLANNAFNEDILGIYKANKKDFKNLEVFTLIDGVQISAYYGSNEKQKLANLITDYVLSKKLFRPDLEAVKKLRKETILNINK